MRVLQLSNRSELKQIMREIKVDPCGIEIMAPKGLNRLVRINSLSNIAANILKQEMLSLGGDVAVGRDALTGKAKKTDCLLMANLAQLDRLNHKLRRQPFGLGKLADDLSQALINYQRDSFVLKLGRYKLDFGARAHITGVVNLTPDSFSGDGLYYSSARCCPLSAVLDYVEKMIRDGADIIEMGGESSRPGAKPVTAKEELSRVIPAIKKISKKIKAPLAVDTCKPEVAHAALDNGAVLVNDITGLKDPKMAKLAARYKAGVVIMHMKGNPRTMQKGPEYVSLIDEIIEFLGRAVDRAVSAGVDKEKIIIDPGIGFGKAPEHNLEILNKLSEFKVLGRPIMVGTSRKSFIGKILDAAPDERIFGTVASCVLAVKNGAKLVRVHDVLEVKQGLRVLDSINKG